MTILAMLTLYRTFAVQFLRWIAGKLERREIASDDGALYLERFKIYGFMPAPPDATPEEKKAINDKRWPFSIYLHRFHLHDLDRAPHNHPWRWSFSIILTGGYDEERLGSAEVSGLCGRSVIRSRRLRPLSFNWLGANSFHRISELHGEVWTLFVTGPKHGKSWGFWVPGRGFQAWRDRLLERGIEPGH